MRPDSLSTPTLVTLHGAPFKHNGVRVLHTAVGPLWDSGSSVLVTIESVYDKDGTVARRSQFPFRT